MATKKPKKIIMIGPIVFIPHKYRENQWRRIEAGEMNDHLVYDKQDIDDFQAAHREWDRFECDCTELHAILHASIT